MRSIPPFSKKSSPGPTVGGGGQRSGFLSHVKSTNAGKGGVPAKGMAGFQGKEKIGGGTPARQAHHPSFKPHSGNAARSVPAFSKKKI